MEVVVFIDKSLSDCTVFYSLDSFYSFNSFQTSPYFLAFVEKTKNDVFEDNFYKISFEYIF